MKKFLSLPLICLLLALFGCGKDAGWSGEVVTYGSGPETPAFFELACEDGKNYGFVVTGDTELVWEDPSALDEAREGRDQWDVFGCSMYVTVIPGETTQSADDYVDECVEGWYEAAKITVTKVDEDYFAVTAKPVIYLYPETETQVSVALDYDGQLTCTYPKYDNGWTVTAAPDGTLTDTAGQTYNYLYWEGVTDTEYDFSQGFCVPGAQTAAFLEEALAALGLTRREANEFIIYWLPMMEHNPYNLIAFQQEAYTGSARLNVTPAPDTLLRVFMAWQPLEEPVEIAPQPLTAPARQGFTAVEWGGTEVSK